MDISTLRQRIDATDKKIFEAIAERLCIAEEVVQWKRERGVPIFDAQREKEIIAEKRELAIKLDISPDTVEEILRALIAESHFREKRVLADDNTSPKKIRRKPIATTLSLLEIFKRIAEQDGDVFFLESLGEDEWSEYSMMGFLPKCVFAARGKEIFKDGVSLGEHKNPLDWLEEQFLPYQNLIPRHSANGFAGGLVGYLSFEAIKYWEKLDLPSHLDFYDFEYGLFLDALVYNRKTETLEYLFLDEDRSKMIEEFLQFSPQPLQKFSGKENGSNFSDAQLEETIADCKKEIVAGNVFQIVPSRRFSYTCSGDPIDLYISLRETNPSPNMFFLRFADRHLVGSSPEMVGKVMGKRIETYPIAGTRSRGKTLEEDALKSAELLSDPKEIAEHLMLVDMARNDLGKVCEFGSVKTESIMALKKYSLVQHLVSTVTGRIKEGISSFRAVLSNFPMGTVSGAPRMEAIKILEKIEKTPRGPYSGAVGYWSVTGDTTLALAIRAFFLSGKNGFSQAGAGIVYDSVPENERNEIEKKSRNIRDLMGKEGK
ncbi:MAG: chorismate-binding protein [Candidatus Peregrinibacteria bacterium]